jgi:CRISPR-associated protein Cas1
MQIEQTQHYRSSTKRQDIAQKFVEGAAFNIQKNLKYYQNRDREVQSYINSIEEYEKLIAPTQDIETLMGIEGNIRHTYYDAFDEIIKNFQMEGRSKQPPKNEVNALISFGNMMCYTLCLDQIYHTQLNPTISFLHEPGYRRYSLALDLAEIFKPILVDRTIFKVLNKKQLQAKHFDVKVNRVVLKEAGKKAFIKAFEDRLNETIKHRTLKKHVSYKHLVKLECYKLSKHILGMETYKPFKIWW